MVGMSFDEMRERLRADAERIYKRWMDEEFDIDYPRASKEIVEFDFMIMETDDKKEIGSMKWTGNIAIGFANGISNYTAQRNSPEPMWVASARNLINAYNLVRVKNCLVAGLAIRKEVDARDRRIVELDLELKQTKDKLDDVNRRLKECGDRVIDLETENQKLRERNPVFGVAQGSVDEVGEDASKKKEEKK